MNQIIHASPKVRKFARQLGADISQLKGTERNGRITEQDVRNFVKNQIKQQENTSKKSIKFKDINKSQRHQQNSCSKL